MLERRDVVLKAPIARAIWSLGWPIVAANELSTLSDSVMLFWLGHMLGRSGLAVESLFRPFGLLLSWLCISTGAGTSVLISRSVGARDGRGLSITATAMTLTLVVWATLTAVVIAFSPQLASVLAGHLDVQRPLLQYLLGTMFAALPATSMLWLLLQVANAAGDTRFTIIRVLVELLFTVALTPALIELGLGIAGAPVSAGINAAGLAVFLWLALVRRRARLHLGEVTARAWRVQRDVWKQILAIGVPVQSSRVAMFGAQLILVRLVARGGETQIAGYGIAGALIMFGAMATYGIAQAGAILIGQSLGAGLHDRARQGVRIALGMGWLVIAAFTIVTFFDRPIIDLFTSDAAIADVAHEALSIMRWGLFGVATWQVLLSAFAAHRTTVKAGLLVILGEGAGLAVAFTWSSSYTDGACAAFIVANIVKAALLLWLFARRAN